MTTRRVFIGVLVLIAAALAASYTGLLRTDKSEPEKIRFLLDWKAGMEYVGFYVAQKKGFYRKAGLDVEIQEGSGATTAVKLIAQRKNDIGLATGDAVILAAREGLPVKSLAVLFQQSPVVVYSLEKNNIRKLEDLRGHTIGVSTGDTKYNYFRGIVNRLGFAGGDLNEVSVGWEVAPLLTGQVDALLGYVNAQPVQVEVEGHTVNVIGLADYGLDLYGETIVVNETALNENPDRYSRFVSASLKGWRYAFDNPSEAVEIFARRFPEQRREFLVKSLEKVIPLFKAREGQPVPLGSQTAEGWSKAVKVMRNFGLLDKDIDPKQLFIEGYGE